MKIHVAYDDRLLAWRGSPSTPVRAKRAVTLLQAAIGDAVDLQAINPKHGRVRNLQFVHDPTYVRDQLETEQGRVAQLMFAATSQLMEQLPFERDAVWLGFSPQGAKHHAMWNHASGFCVFNDMAYVARVLSAMGERVAYIDFDAHHGDGVEALTYHDSHIFTASIHEDGIFPGTGLHDAPAQQVWNWALPAESGDREFKDSIHEALELCGHFKPTVLLVAAGADGHETDPLSSLRYTLEGYKDVARAIGRWATYAGATRILVGGAGGYQPDDVTPQVWSTFLLELARSLEDPSLHEAMYKTSAE